MTPKPAHDAALWSELESLRARVVELETALRDAERRCQTPDAFGPGRDFLQTLIDTIPDGFYYKDREGRFICVNRAQAAFLAIDDPAEAVGKTDFDFFSEAHSRLARQDEDAILRTGQPMLDRLEEFDLPDGGHVFMSASKVPVRDQNGSIIGIVGLSRDISERRRIEETLRLKEERFRMLGAAVHDALYDCDMQTGHTWRSEGYKRLCGGQESIGDHHDWWKTRIHPDDFEAVVASHQSIMEKGGPIWSGEYRFRRNDGEYIYIAERGYMVYDAQGQPVRMIGALTDITARKHAEEALRLSEERFRLVSHITHDALYDWNIQTGEVWRSDGYQRLLATDQRVGDQLDWWVERIHPDDYDAVMSGRGRAFVAGDPIWSGEYRFRRDTGGYAHVIERGCILYDADSEPLRMVGALTDITERRQAEARILHQYRQLLALQAAGAAISSSLDLPYVLNTVVYQLAAMLGVEGCTISEWHREENYVVAIARYKPSGWQQVEGVTPIFPLSDYPTTRQMLIDQAIVQHTVDQPDLDPAERAYMQEYGFKTALLLPMIYHDRVVGLVELEDTREKRTFSDEDIALAQVLANQAASAIENARLYAHAQQEIAERKRIEDALRRSEEQYRLLIESSPDPTATFDLDARVMYVNPAFVQVFGWTADEVAGHRLDSFAFIPDSAESSALWGQLKSEGKFAGVETRRVTKDGRALDVQISASGYRDREGQLRGYVAIYHDITERLRAQEQTLQLAVEREQVKMLGSFLRDASHDFRTPLSTINTSLYLLRKAQDVERAAHHLDILQQQTNHLERLVDGLFTLSRLDSLSRLDFRILNLNELLHDLRARVEPLAAQNGLTVVFSSPAQLPLIEADAVELHRALKSIIENAVSYSRKGTITVTCRTSDDEAEIAVTDEGIGISPEDQQRIFDRFFRADPARSSQTGGLGLGLSIARKVVEGHRGSILVQSAIDEGSTFTVTLPLKQH